MKRAHAIYIAAAVVVAVAVAAVAAVAVVVVVVVVDGTQRPLDVRSAIGLFSRSNIRVVTQ